MAVEVIPLYHFSTTDRKIKWKRTFSNLRAAGTTAPYSSSRNHDIGLKTVAFGDLLKKGKSQAKDVVAQIFNLRTQVTEAGRSLELEVSMVYIASSWPSRATQSLQT